MYSTKVYVQNSIINKMNKKKKHFTEVIKFKDEWKKFLISLFFALPFSIRTQNINIEIFIFIYTLYRMLARYNVKYMQLFTIMLI